MLVALRDLPRHARELDHARPATEADDDFAGMTPLHAAAEHGNTTAAALFLAAGVEVGTRAGVSIRDDVIQVPAYQGWAALHFAAANGHAEMVRCQAQVRACLAQDLTARRLQVQLLLERGADALAAAYYGHTPLHCLLARPDSFVFGAADTHVCALDALLAAGASLHCVDQQVRVSVFQSVRPRPDLTCDCRA